MTRPSRKQVYIEMALVLAKRGNCPRRQVGCILTNTRGQILSTGYNGSARGLPMCSRGRPCPGYHLASGEGLDKCEAIHAEANALLQCPDVEDVYYCYSTHAPCLHCTKLLMNTGCRIIIYAKDYPHSTQAKELWFKKQNNFYYGKIDEKSTI